MSDPLVSVDGVTKVFAARSGFFRRRAEIRALDGVTLAIRRRETIGLVGESGSGKTTLGRIVLRLIPPTAGTVHFDGIDVHAADAPTLRRLRRRMQIVFQDATGSLNPRMTVGAAVREPMIVHHLHDRSTLAARVHTLFEDVGLDPALTAKYPHELSGGQRQRVGIARALSVQPEFLVLDEPVSALDVSIQAQVLNLLADLRERHGLTYLFVAHDLGVVRYLCDSVVVMYRGRVVETGARDVVFTDPRHPYTADLLAAIPGAAPREPLPDGAAAVDAPRSGETSGCPYRGVCTHPAKDALCRTAPPVLHEIRPNRHAACHHADQGMAG
jgi:oligopeptide/dipeptide ABC transporter ATP-binding protein